MKTQLSKPVAIERATLSSISRRLWRASGRSAAKVAAELGDPSADTLSLGATGTAGEGARKAIAKPSRSLEALRDTDGGHVFILVIKSGGVCCCAMARMPRIEFDGALYHLLCRGDRREAIFRDDKDREIFLATLGEVCHRNGWRVHAYVLLSNHYHFLVETPKSNLVRGMHRFQATYTMRYNRRHKLSGHLFAGRYKRS